MGDALEHALAVRKREAILRELVHGLDALSDEQLVSIDDPVGLGKSMAGLLVAATGSFGQLVGPMYHAQALESLWSISRQELGKQVTAGQVLALQVGDEYLFPVFQFKGRTVREEVLAVVRVLRTAVDPFTIAQWLCTPQQDDPSGRTPLQRLNDGEYGQVLAEAERATTRWSA